MPYTPNVHASQVLLRKVLREKLAGCKLDDTLLRKIRDILDGMREDKSIEDRLRIISLAQHIDGKVLTIMVGVPIDITVNIDSNRCIVNCSVCKHYNEAPQPPYTFSIGDCRVHQRACQGKDYCAQFEAIECPST